MKSKEEIVWLIYDVLDDTPSITNVRDAAVEAKVEYKRDVYEKRTVSTLLDSGAEVRVVVTEPFLGGKYD
jgi:hypothetical protein